MGRSDADNAEAHNAELMFPGLADAKRELAEARRDVHQIAARLGGPAVVGPACLRVLIERACADENPVRRVQNEAAFWRDVLKFLLAGSLT